ncbi:hypothetical protein BASA50_000231 [Batrachochytrium salamandrivorans]|uniref:Nucleoside phosphorylase domain-containing protein n=1 Tax=Batrachochytrium salamandrivorans TaxID=1357716 RepID=A0ABQ8EUK4_9FUNG|nr:hypothetical protein BASA60_003506 [Batrachochytrium salamandrivorans]KAH6583670.1 hypothetical protein BASA61_007896 [Batrachochytrium salamandrivorans]KAH6586867.1 hypothetical protein BASA50_000231 [Batrachochytrium salamandrivorans]KAH9274660.1 hypothetical protein BASA83_002845 [Batrachochytrium salamandrivorans]KAJ1342236.1 hypothetical protein BSLG_003159 [Batrachochytrium salamandrivorans]
MAPINNMKNANFPVDDEGRTYHVGVKVNEVANRIITVGDPKRALKIAVHLDTRVFTHESKRGFTTITGTYKGVAVSLVAIGMGTPMADMMVREIREVVSGPILLIRFGSCGGIGDKTRVGMMTVSKDGAVGVSRNYDYFEPMYSGVAPDASSEQGPYLISKICPADSQLSDELMNSLCKCLGEESVLSGLNATADSFYSSQGRQDPGFNDYNSDLIEVIRKKYPNCETLEMESHMLLHLARCATFKSPDAGIRAAACAMVFADRNTNAFIAPETVHQLEDKASIAILDALVSCPM